VIDLLLRFSILDGEKGKVGTPHAPAGRLRPLHPQITMSERQIAQGLPPLSPLLTLVANTRVTCDILLNTLRF